MFPGRVTIVLKKMDQLREKESLDHLKNIQECHKIYGREKDTSRRPESGSYICLCILKKN